MKFTKWILIMIGCMIFPLIARSADPVLHSMEMEGVDPYLFDGWYLLHIHADQMEEALAQVIHFYESHGFGTTREFEYSGIPIILEDSPISPEVLPLDTKIRTSALHKIVDNLCSKTRGAYRSTIQASRILVVRRQVNSLLYGLKVDAIRQSRISIREALELVLKSASASSRKFNIRLEVPQTILIREGIGPSVWKMYNHLSPRILDQEISPDMNGDTLLDGLTAILLAQPYPFYLHLQAETQPESDYTHVLRFDTLPQTPLRDVESNYGNGRYRID